MGWYFSSQSRSELIAKLTQSEETERASVKVIAHALRGNVLWSVAEITAKTRDVHPDLAPGQSIRFIRCDLLDGSSGQWGHKPLEESMHPYYSGCCHMNFVCCAHRWAMRPTMTNTRSHQPGWAHDRDSGVCRHSFLPESS